MHCRSIRLMLIAVCLLAFPSRSPAPLIYRPGEGWTYEPVGGEGNWQQPRAKDQLEVAQAAFDKKAYSLALKAARLVCYGLWPLSDYAPQAQYLIARCYEAAGKTEKAFKEYQTLLEKQPKMAQFRRDSAAPIRDRQPVPRRQMVQALGLRSRLPVNGTHGHDVWRHREDRAVQPDRAAGAIEHRHRTEKQKALGFRAPDYSAAIKAYDLAADRYHDRPQVAAEAIFRAGLAYHKEAATPDRDQSTAGQAIAQVYRLHGALPERRPRVPQAQKIIASLKG